MFRKRRRPTPNFKIPPPYHPIQGEQANLRQDGTSPFCAMMQVAAEDTYDDYVICRGFDPRILRFIDYAEGDANKPGISVAKPFGKRSPGTYQIAEVYPAFLPAQGNASFADFRQVVYTPPSPANVLWRVGQNPGVVVGGLEGGQPEALGDEIEILYDHNGKVVNWLLIDSKGDGGGNVLGYCTFIEDYTLVAEACPITVTPPRAGLFLVTEPPCSNMELGDEELVIYDPLGCILDLPEADLVDARFIFGRGTIKNPFFDNDPGTEEEPNPCYSPNKFICEYTLIDRCCVAADFGG